MVKVRGLFGNLKALQVEQEFDDLFRDMDDVRKAVKRELEGLGGERPYDAEVRAIDNDSY